MKQLLIIPDRNNLADTMKLAEKYSLGFEYNDFYMPAVLDSAEQINSIVSEYKKINLPDYCTLHGAFFDVIPFSPDPKIRKISVLRIEQSIAVAEKTGAKAVVFHTNYNPFLNSKAYIRSWISENIAFWSGILENHSNVFIYLENMFDTTPDIMCELAENLSRYSNFGICLDYAHASLSKVNPKEWAAVLGKYVKHIHINDNDLISDLHLAWGNGKIDRNSFYSCYEQYMNNASVLIETASAENKLRSLEQLEADGFITMK